MKAAAKRAAACGLAVAAGLLAACAPLPKEPDPRPPTLGIGADDRYDGAPDAAQPDPADLRWWRRFDDPALAAWVERALAGDPGVAIARERVQQARALLRQASARRSPQVAASVGADLDLRRRGGGERAQRSAAVGLDWEIDLWGGLDAGVRAAGADLERGRLLVQAQRLATAGLAARAYIAWRAALADRALLDEAAVLQDEALRVADVRVRAGISPRLDRERARAERAATQAERADAAVRAGRALAALQVLAGERPRPSAATPDGAPEAGPSVAPAAPSSAAPAASPPVAAGPAPTPAGEGAASALTAQAMAAVPTAAPVAAGRPADLLRRRPDLLAAEQALVSAAAEVGVAGAALRPRLRLPATLVLGGPGLGDVVAATIGAALDATLFDAGARRAGVEAAQSRAREAALVYTATLLEALAQVETALLDARGAAARIEARREAAAAAGQAVQQAETLYRAGLSGFLDVVDAQRSALDNRRALLQARADAAAAATLAFEALGLVDPAPAPDAGF